MALKNPAIFQVGYVPQSIDFILVVFTKIKFHLK